VESRRPTRRPRLDCYRAAAALGGTAGRQRRAQGRGLLRVAGPVVGRGQGGPDRGTLAALCRWRPISGLTTPFLAWCCAKLAAAGQTALLLVWDNASWHISQEVRRWIATHNRQVKMGDAAVRIVPCPLPIKSPWLNPIEPKWVHGKKRIVEPTRLLTMEELETRVYDALGADHADHLTMPEKAA
jgi:transposase